MSETKNRRLDLVDYQAMAAKNHRGLVAMTFVTEALPHKAGETAGYKPAEAMRLHNQGMAYPYGHGHEMPAEAIQETPLPDDESRRKSSVMIPEKILEGHHLPMLPIAKAISGRDVSKKDEAIAIIQEELDRRTALRGDAGQQPFLSTQTAGSTLAGGART